ncbi:MULTISPECIES: hypothetical protein [unclassified Streptomyces]|uniref:hypothetical protein n=1 Tax=unclassified Streptomyces TaxID=2593676 RepID=UPI0037FA604F
MSTRTLRVTLAERHGPSLPAGTYTVTARQAAPTGASGDALTHEAELQVRVPRFALAATDVITAQPVPGSVGEMDLTMPHIVLASSALPWSRPLDANDEQVPWMSLLVVREDDILPGPGGAVLTPRTGKDLTGVTSGVALPDLGTLSDADQVTPCLTVDIKAERIADLMPHRGELRWLTHVRTVDIAAEDAKGGKGGDNDAGNKAKQEEAEQPGWQPGDFAAVASSRLPRAAGACTAVLVSLEGWADYAFLGGSTALPTQAKAVRMVVLWSWTFTATGKGRLAGFQGLAEKLSADSRRDDGLLRLPRTVRKKKNRTRPTKQAEHVISRLEAGAVPVGWQLPTGERVPAWYRGPFIPHPSPSLAGQAPFTSADQALVVWEKHGVYDVGYAGAFTAGQLLGLAHPELGQTLQQARGAAHRAVRASLAPAGTGTAGPFGWLNGAPSMPGRLEQTLAGDVAQKITKGLKALSGGAVEKSGTLSLGTAVGAAAPPAAAEPGSATGSPGLTCQEVIDALTTPRAAPATDSGPAARKASEREVLLGQAVQAAGDAVAHTVRFYGDKVAQALPAWSKLIAQIPFHFLIPHEGMLPEHSIRFFHLDALWLDVMVAGALRCGAVTTLDHYTTDLLHHLVRDDSDPVLLGAQPQTGCLVRSPLIAQWPDLIVEAFSKKAGTETPVPVSTIHPLSDVLLVLFAGPLPDRLQLREPPHGLSLGLDAEGVMDLRAPVPMKDAHGKDHPEVAPGRHLTDCQATGITTRADKSAGGSASEVLRIDDDSDGCLTARLKAAYKDAGVPASHVLGPASAALQILNKSGVVEFRAAT